MTLYQMQNNYGSILMLMLVCFAIVIFIMTTVSNIIVLRHKKLIIKQVNEMGGELIKIEMIISDSSKIIYQFYYEVDNDTKVGAVQFGPKSQLKWFYEH